MSRALPLLLFVCLLAPEVQASHGDDERCRTRDAACLIAAATSYLDALLSNDATHIRLASSAWRANNGHATVEGEQEVRDGVETGECIVGSIQDKRWYVDQEQSQAIAFYYLLADGGAAATCEDPLFPDVAQIPAFIAERFRVLDGLIHEIEVIYFGEAPGTMSAPRPYRDTDFGPFGCGDMSPACLIETGMHYLGALVSHDASQVPLAPDAWQLENGKNTGDNADAIRASLPVTTALIVAVEDVRWFIDGEHAVAYYVRWSEPTGDPDAPREDWSASYYATRFRVDDGLIKEIESVFSMPDQLGRESSYPDVDGDGHAHVDDNCTFTPNPGQEDQGGLASAQPDGIGDACQCGDVTGEGIANGQDGVVILRHGLGVAPNPLFAVPGNCDVGGNGVCNGQDGYFVTRAALGLATGNLFGQHCPAADPSVPCQECW